MAIIKHTRLADAVLALLDVILPQYTTFYAEPYQNGRESGWAVFVPREQQKIVFAEYRRSDELVVYEGQSTEFDESNIPSEIVYKAKRLYAQNDLQSAAEYIKSYLIS